MLQNHNKSLKFFGIETRKDRNTLSVIKTPVFRVTINLKPAELAEQSLKVKKKKKYEKNKTYQGCKVR